MCDCLDNCRGQAYDVVANMMGHISGVAKSYRNVHRLQLHAAHYFAHSINLVLQDVAKQCRPVKDALDLVHDLVKLFRNSPNCRCCSVNVLQICHSH